MADIPGFLTRKGDSLEFNGDGEFVFYVPEKFFETNNAVIEGEYINILGMLDYAIFDKNGKHSGLKPFRFPTIFMTKPSVIEKQKDIKLAGYVDKQDYRFLKYKKGDQIVVNVKVPQTVNNVEAFYRLFIGGHIPTTIKYNEIQNYFIENMKLNGEAYGVTMQLIGIVIGESARSRSDVNIPFCQSGSTDMYGYKFINIREIPKYTSSFAAITSENWDEAVVNAIITPNQKESPMEKILMD